MNFRLLLMLMITIVSCSTDDEDAFFNPLTDLSEQRFVGKILPDTEGYWIITRTVSNRNCTYCSSINFIDGIAYVGEKTVNRDALGYFLDSEIKNNQLLVLTSTEILNFSRTLQRSSVLKAEGNEQFRRMTKDQTGRIWILTNECIFSRESVERIPFPNTMTALDFKVDKNNSFWISSTDTVYHVKKNSLLCKYSIKDIAGTRNNTSGIYGLKIDKQDSIWINTSENIFKFQDNKWKIVKTDVFSIDNFKTIPFMDVDISGNVWLAEKNYQAFTTLHCFNGTSWSSYKLNPPVESWITDIETVEAGSIWIGTTNGLQKLNIN